jgi:hypothetical protein
MSSQDLELETLYAEVRAREKIEIERVKARVDLNRIRNDEFKCLSKNIGRLPQEVVIIIKTYIGLYDEEKEQEYFDNSTVNLPRPYGRYKNTCNGVYTCVMKYNYNDNNIGSIILSSRMNRKKTQRRYYIGEFRRVMCCDGCGNPRNDGRCDWDCSGYIETLDHYQTYYVCDDLNVSVIMFWGILHEIKLKHNK